jgi:hypothetical protein
MKDMVQKKYKALNLRKLGLSYSEISAEIGVPKATVASWVQWAPLTEYQKTLLAGRLKLKQRKGRFAAGIALKARRIYREKAAYDQAEGEFKTLIADPLFGSFFVYGLGLYSGKTIAKDETKTGGKNSSNFQFTTADPEKARLMMQWVKRYLKMWCSKEESNPKSGIQSIQLRVFAHEPYRNSNLEAFWSRTMAVPLDRFKKTIYTPKSSFYKKKSDYRGSLAITLSSIQALRTVLAWQKLLIKYYKDTL